MRSILAKKIKDQEDKSKKNIKRCIQPSLFRMKYGNILGQSQKMEQQRQQANYNQSQSLYKKFALDKMFLQGERNALINAQTKMPRDQLFNNILSFFQSVNNEDEQDNLQITDYPFYCHSDQFMQYILQQEQFQKGLENKFYKLGNQVQKIINSETLKTQLEKDLRIYSNKNETMIKSYQEEKKKAFQKSQRNKELIFQIGNKFNQITTKNEILKSQVDCAEQKLEIVKSEFLTIVDLQQRLQNKLTCEKFEISIIKLQQTNTLYRYGAILIQSQIQKADYLQKKCFKFQSKVNGITLLDLKIFILTTLYPMASSIFNDFSSQSNVYKAMFGLNTLSKEEEESSLIILNMRIEKYLHFKKYNSFKDYLSQNIKLRKKILFIVSLNRFLQILNQIVTLLQKFQNNLLHLTKVNIEQISKNYDGTNFSHYLMQIDFSYKYSNFKTVFQVFLCNPQSLKVQQIEYLRSKSEKNQQVFIWFQIPKTQLQEQRIQTYEQINHYLSKSKLFHSSNRKPLIK